MANLSQTAASVAVNGPSQVSIVQVGEAVTQGQPGYLDTTTGKYFQADANASATVSSARCIFLTPASTDGYAVAVFEGDVNLGATLAVGQTYTVSATKGAICPLVDLTTGDYPTILGVATTTSNLKLKIFASGVIKP